MQNADLYSLLKANPYPGRGILLGRSPDGGQAVIAYFIMGRSENSRNRVFEKTADGIRTRAFDESKLTDPSLIIYHPVRTLDSGLVIVTNGDQTDTIKEYLEQGKCYRHALLSRTFEPDAPNYTPRISGVVKPDGSYNLSILKSLDGDADCCCRYFYEYDAPRAGVGHLIHTYQGDGSPLPSFEGEPVRVALTAPDPETLAAALWESLDADNRISLFVQYRDLKTGQAKTVLCNKHKEG